MTIDIRPKTIFIALGIYFLAIFIFQIKEVIFLVFFAYILSCALYPVLQKLQSYGISKPISIFLIYLVIISILTILVLVGTRPIIDQFAFLATNLPSISTRIYDGITYYAPNISNQIDFAQFQKELIQQQNVTQVLGGISNAIVGIFQFSINSLMILVLTGFMLFEKGDNAERNKNFFNKILGNTRGEKFLSVLSKVETKLGSWFAGQLVICLSSGTLTFIVFTVLGFSFALPMAIIAAILEAVPNIGPVIAVILGVILALGSGVNTSIITVLIYVIAVLAYQQFQSFYLAPKIMNRAIGINPIILLIAILAVANFKDTNFGTIMLVVPFTAILQIIFEEFYYSK